MSRALRQPLGRSSLVNTILTLSVYKHSDHLGDSSDLHLRGPQLSWLRSSFGRQEEIFSLQTGAKMARFMYSDGVAKPEKSGAE